MGKYTDIASYLSINWTIMRHSKANQIFYNILKFITKFQPI